MISTICRDNLKAIAQAYGKATGQSMTAISKEFYGNSTFLPKFFATGKPSISLNNYDRVLGLFLEHWPDEAKWPILRVIVIRGPVKNEGKSISSPIPPARNHLPVPNAAAARKRRSGVRADPA